MAKVFEYAQIANRPHIGNVRRQRPDAKAAILKKKLPDKIADEFLDMVEDSDTLSDLLGSLQKVVAESKDNALGADALKKYAYQDSLQRKIFAKIVAAQLNLKFKDVFLEIHIKASALQLWFQAKGGGKQVVCQWKGT